MAKYVRTQTDPSSGLSSSFREISNCGVGISIGTSVGSEVLLDFTVTNTPVFVQTTTAASIYIDNAELNNVTVVVGTTAGATVLAGSTGTMKIVSWAQGNIYSGKNTTGKHVQSNVTPSSKPASLLDSTGKVYGQDRPQYETYSSDQCQCIESYGI
jgi:glucan 1,3-beta-glucosidase